MRHLCAGNKSSRSLVSDLSLLFATGKVAAEPNSSAAPQDETDESSVDQARERKRVGYRIAWTARLP
jgi:hypothetical protein